MKLIITMNDDRTFNVEQQSEAGSSNTPKLTFDKLLRLILDVYFSVLTPKI